jgi:hypothetical protein
MGSTKLDARKLGRELAAVLDRIEREEADLKEETKDRRGRIAKLHRRVNELRDLLAGRSGEQLGVPGTETSEADRGEAAQAGAPTGEVLRWTEESDGRVLGQASDGIMYAVKPHAGGWRWEQGKRRGHTQPTVKDAQLAAEADDLERQAP